MKKPRPAPIEVEIVDLVERGVGTGVSADGSLVRVRGGAPGTRVRVAPGKRRRGVYEAVKLQTVRPAVGGATPQCAQFGRCGGCVLQELDLIAQREAKAAMVARLVGALADVRVHPLRGAPQAYGYRNKLELAFGGRGWHAEADRHLPNEGKFLGFHPPGRFDRIVDTPACALAGVRMAEALRVVRQIALDADSPPPWDPHVHTGFWRHLVLRESAEGLLVGLVTAPAGDGEAEWAERVLLALQPVAQGTVWLENSGVADVARGTVRAQWGESTLTERLAGIAFQLSLESFFQTNTAGAERLVETVGEALGTRGGTLVDLYCGVGTLGLALSGRFDRLLGIEEVPSAVADARSNAERAGVAATFHVGRVEDLSALLAGEPNAAIVVDPPRAGLHPRVAGVLAHVDARVLVYVACAPASLGRDRLVLEAGGWRATDLWCVDLFPQTGHVEAVMRFERSAL